MLMKLQINLNFMVDFTEGLKNSYLFINIL